MTWLIIAGYIVVGLVTVRVTYTLLNKSNGGFDGYDVDEVATSSFIGVAWPLAVLIFGGYYLFRHTLFKETKAQKATRTKREEDQARLVTLRALKKDAPDLLSEQDLKEMRDLERRLEARRGRGYYY